MNMQFPFNVVQSKASKVDKEFSSIASTVLTSGSGCYDTPFRIYDKFGNLLDNMLLDRFQPHLGLITYTVTDLD